jgi:hypothetical protein
MEDTDNIGMPYKALREISLRYEVSSLTLFPLLSTHVDNQLTPVLVYTKYLIHLVRANL